jgi:hypothetical protein
MARLKANMQQQMAAQNTGTSAPQGGTTGLTPPHKRGPPREKKSPAPSDNPSMVRISPEPSESPENKKKTTSSVNNAEFASVHPLAESETKTETRTKSCIQLVVELESGMNLVHHQPSVSAKYLAHLKG